jgi:integrase
MPRKRTNGLPPYVYRGRSAYDLHIYNGKGLPRQVIRLCDIDIPMSEIWRAYELFHSQNIMNLDWLLMEYQKSDLFHKNATRTIKYQSEMMQRIINYPRGKGNILGTAELKNITAGVLRKYSDSRAKIAAVSANREVSLISAAWNWALERDIIKYSNPCAIVKRNKEKARTRYVTEEEYQIAYRLAEKYPYLQPAMELAYLCRMRRCEILGATRKQILSEGFDTLRAKGSRDAITLWSTRLRKAVKADAKVTGIYVIHDKQGQRITESAFKSAWTRLKKLMIEAGIEPFNFHDLKAAGVSDTTGDKLKASGHHDAKMLKIYDRKKNKVKPTR